MTAANLYFSVWLTVLEGCGKVAEVARLRLQQSIVGYAMMWVALGLGAGLWAAVFVPLASALGTGLWLHRSASLLTYLRAQPECGADDRIRWRRDVFPFQWRIAVSWVSGYFIFQVFTPLTFARHGAVEAGRLGLALAIYSALLTVGMSWVSAKLPSMAAHVSRKERHELNAVFGAVAKRSMVFMSAAVILLLLGMQGLVLADAPVASRIASVPVLACLSVVTLVNCFIFAAAGYMRAHMEEPMLGVSVVAGLATLLTALLGVEFGVLSMMFFYALVVSLIALPWTVWLFLGYYRRPS